MKFRVYFKDNKYFPTYFRTRREAAVYCKEHGGAIQKKIGNEWFNI